MKRIIACLSFGLLAIPAHPQSAAVAAKPTKTLKYLTAAEIEPSRLLQPPPLDGSDAQRKEMAAVKQLIKSRTAERYEQAKWDAEHEDASPFAAVIGAGFDMQKLPATAKLLDAVLNDQAIAASNAKDYFKRKFPVTAEMPQSYGEWTRQGRSETRFPPSAWVSERPRNFGLFGRRGSGVSDSGKGASHSVTLGRLRLQSRGLRRSLSRRRRSEPCIGHRRRSNASPQCRAGAPVGSSESGTASGAPHRAIAGYGFGLVSSGGSGIVTAPVAAHSAPRTKVATNPGVLTALISFPSMVAKTRPAP